MKNRIIYCMVSVVAFGLLSQKAMADDSTYFKVVSTQAAIPIKTDSVPVERALSYPVVVERTSTMSAMIDGKATPVIVEETKALPLMLERTSVAKPHHWPLSFGVWP